MLTRSWTLVARPLAGIMSKKNARKDRGALLPTPAHSVSRMTLTRRTSPTHEDHREPLTRRTEQSFTSVWKVTGCQVYRVFHLLHALVVRGSNSTRLTVYHSAQSRTALLYETTRWHGEGQRNMVQIWRDQSTESEVPRRPPYSPTHPLDRSHQPSTSHHAAHKSTTKETFSSMAQDMYESTLIRLWTLSRLCTVHSLPGFL